MMIGTRCRISFLQYLPKKPTKFGIKVFVCSKDKTGYTLTFQAYTEKSKDTNSGSKLVSHRMHCKVMTLVDSYLGKGHWVFMDNYCSNSDLFLDFLKHNTYATGTIRPGRKNYPQLLRINSCVHGEC